jgi:hypothetical protein
MIKMENKYVVFDLDETLGYFTEIGIIWNCLKTSYNISGQIYFDKLCETFEKQYFRPGIFKALHYLYKKKAKVVLYTNNTGELSWLKMIISYLEKRSNARGLFIEIVPGYKPGMKGPCARKSFDKTYPEVLRCAKLPPDSKLMFFDDQPHPGMKHPNVKYVRVKAYLHPIRPAHIIEILQKSYFQFLDYGTHSYIYKCIKNFHNHYIAQGYHYRSSRVSDNDIIMYLRKFYGTTRRNRKNSGNKTRKN